MAVNQEFHISVTPIGGEEYLVRTERVAPGVPLAEEKVRWPVQSWLQQASVLMNDPLRGLLRGDGNLVNLGASSHLGGPNTSQNSDAAANLSDAAAGANAGASNGAGSLGNPGGAANGNLTANLISLGRQLYDALFQGTIRDSWMRAQGIAQHRQEILRLRLGLKDDLLPRLPWEVLHAGDRPLATGTDVVFCRYHSGFGRMATPISLQMPVSELNEPLRILMIVAAPSDQERLALNKEIEQLKAELNGTLREPQGPQSPQIELTILDQPGREELTQALEHRHYHVMHYAGHSNLGTTGGDISLVSRQTGLTETLSGDDLAGLLVNNGIQMAVFNSCRGVYTATEETSIVGNLAEALVRRGIPAVLAMSERIPDNVAINLSRLFYRNLKRAYPVDLSLNRARQGLISSYSSDQLYWALPILYLHADFDGYLQPPLESQHTALEAVSSASIAVGSPRSGSSTLTHAGANAGANAEMVAGTGTRGGAIAPQGARSNAHTVGAIGPWSAEELDDDFDPEELEFDDSEAGEDMALVSQMLTQLSQGSGLAGQPTTTGLAAEDENLLPDHLAHQGGRLAGSPTDPVALYLQAIRSNPKDAAAHEQLGLAYLQQGSMPQAIATLRMAVNLAPQRAESHNSLGLALTEQGDYAEAIQTYNQAIQLNPQLSSAYQNLKVALQQQSQHPKRPHTQQEKRPTTPPSPLNTAVLADNHKTGGNAVSNTPQQESLALDNHSPGIHRPGPQEQQPSVAASVKADVTQRPWLPQKPLHWLGLGALGVALAGSGALLARLPAPPSAVTSLPTLDKQPAILESLDKASNQAVLELAKRELDAGHWDGVQQAIQLLLANGRNLNKEASELAQQAIARNEKNPELRFLAGRALWQQAMTASNDTEKKTLIADAKNHWETLVNQSSSNAKNPRYHNALGFAYYAQGEYLRALKVWNESIQALKDTTGPSQNPDYVTAYAGIAMAYAKLAAQNKSDPQNLQRAISFRNEVLQINRREFDTPALNKQWLWTEAMLHDWDALKKLKG